MPNYVEMCLSKISPDHCFQSFGFLNFYELLSLTRVPMGAKIQNANNSYSYESCSTKLFLNIPCDSPHKS